MNEPTPGAAAHIRWTRRLIYMIVILALTILAAVRWSLEQLDTIDKKLDAIGAFEKLGHPEPFFLFSQLSLLYHGSNAPEPAACGHQYYRPPLPKDWVDPPNLFELLNRRQPKRELEPLSLSQAAPEREGGVTVKIARRAAPDRAEPKAEPKPYPSFLPPLIHDREAESECRKFKALQPVRTVKEFFWNLMSQGVVGIVLTLTSLVVAGRILASSGSGNLYAFGLLTAGVYFVFGWVLIGLAYAWGIVAGWVGLLVGGVVALVEGPLHLRHLYEAGHEVRKEIKQEKTTIDNYPS